MNHTLSITTCMAPNYEFHCLELAEYLSTRLGMPVQTRLDVTWQERERMLDDGEADLAWICGLPYIQKADQGQPSVRLLAAPVMQAGRYNDRPVYYSDVVVRRTSPFESLADLRGRAWAYNEPNSHSGYNVVRSTLVSRGLPPGWFGRVVEAGAHQESLRLILAGEVDAAAIDTTVLEMELRRRPELAGQIRVIDTFGPSPSPPWVTRAGLSEALHRALQQAFLSMHANPDCRALLQRAGMARFAAVTDRDYDPIRAMDQAAAGYLLAPQR